MNDGPRCAYQSLLLTLTTYTLRYTLRYYSREHYTHREIFSKSYCIKLKSDCIYHFPIDLEPNGRPFGSKSIGKW